MINKETVLECIKTPMKQYHQKMKSTIGDWKVLVHVTEKLLAGKEVKNEEFPSVFLPLIEMMRLILRVTKDSKWDWSDPAIQETYKNISESEIYKNFADATVGVVSSIVRKVEIGTLVEVGTGPGQVTTRLCREMVRANSKVPIIISDKSPGISQTGENLRNAFPSLTIYDFVWDFGADPPAEMIEKLTRPVLLFERFCVPYGGYGAIDKIGPVADVLIMVEYLSLTGRKEAYDIINEKIGTQFFTYSEAIERLEKYFSFIHRCDRETVKAVNAPVTIFTLAVK
ncbi:MAG: hypothetical protein KAJ08_15245 [Deltaproteobacteria bacterium]|nr:hypothetical protein [Deltaproteobacteria bacterium]